MAKNNTLSYRVGQLEKSSEKIDEKMDKILENEIPHLQLTLAQLKTRMDVLTIINVGAIVTAIILNQIF